LAPENGNCLEEEFRDGLPTSLKLETAKFTTMIGEAANASNSTQLQTSATPKSLQLADADLLFTSYFLNFE
jgi:hypothetical protein